MREAIAVRMGRADDDSYKSWRRDQRYLTDGWLSPDEDEEGDDG